MKGDLEKESGITAIARELKLHVKILGGGVALIWAIQIVNFILFQGKLVRFGIHPRHLDGLMGILFAPFLHGGFYHVAANTVPFVVLGWFLMLRDTREFFFVSVISALVSGAGTWLIGSPYSVHVGASGMIFGYFGCLLARGYFERNIPSIALSLVAFLGYGSLIFGVLPGQNGISWEGHLFGFLGGILAAKLLAKNGKR